MAKFSFDVNSLVKDRLDFHLFNRVEGLLRWITRLSRKYFGLGKGLKAVHFVNTGALKRRRQFKQ